MKQQSQGGFLLAKVHQLGGRIFGRLLRNYGVDQLNPAQGRIMFVLWQEDGIPIKELAKRTQLDKSTLTSMLDRLEKAGLIQRIPSKQDRRTILLHRTPKDRDLEVLYIHVSKEMEQIWYRGFNNSSIKHFERDLQRILKNLTDFEREQ
jgi:DNA-binding MarR family transcriptional regulator